MSIQSKINEIRRKPEHIRIRYAWALAAIGTFFVVIIWFISLNAQRETTQEPVFTDDQFKSLDQLGNQTQSIREQTQQMKNAFDQMNKQNSLNQDNTNADQNTTYQSDTIDLNGTPGQ